MVSFLRLVSLLVLVATAGVCTSSGQASAAKPNAPAAAAGGSEVLPKRTVRLDADRLSQVQKDRAATDDPTAAYAFDDGVELDITVESGRPLGLDPRPLGTSDQAKAAAKRKEEEAKAEAEAAAKRLEEEAKAKADAAAKKAAEEAKKKEEAKAKADAAAQKAAEEAKKKKEAKAKADAAAKKAAEEAKKKKEAKAKADAAKAKGKAAAPKKGAVATKGPNEVDVAGADEEAMQEAEKARWQQHREDSFRIQEELYEAELAELARAQEEAQKLREQEDAKREAEIAERHRIKQQNIESRLLQEAKAREKADKEAVKERSRRLVAAAKELAEATKAKRQAEADALASKAEFIAAEEERREATMQGIRSERSQRRLQEMVAKAQPQTFPKGTKPAELNARLLEAAEQGDHFEVHRLVAAGAKLDCKDKEGNSPLMLAALGDHLPLVDFFASQGASLDAPNKGGDTPLMSVVRNGQVDMARALVQRGADVNAQNSKRRTGPLHVAIENAHPELTHYLLSKSAVIDKNAKAALETSELCASELSTRFHHARLACGH